MPAVVARLSNRTAGRLVPICFGLSLLVGCGHGAVVRPEPQFPRCRELAAADRRLDLPPVRWFGPGQDDEVGRHFAGCRAVGPMLLRRADRTPEPVDSLAILSFNVDLGAASAIELIDSLRSGRFTGGTPVRDFVLLLQETFREGPMVPDPVPDGSGVGRAHFPTPERGERIDVARIADSLDLHLFYAPAMRSGRGRNPAGRPEDRGNAILATVPLTGLTTVELPYGGARRIGQVARIDGRTRTGTAWWLDIANVHFDVGPVGPSALSAIRARQARAMAAVLAPVDRVILGGDLNAFSLFGTAESVQILERAFPESPVSDPGPTRGWQRLDYLFFRVPPEYQARPYARLPLDFGSDHRPILGWVVFTTGRPASVSAGAARPRGS